MPSTEALAKELCSIMMIVVGRSYKNNYSGYIHCALMYSVLLYFSLASAFMSFQSVYFFIMNSEYALIGIMFSVYIAVLRRNSKVFNEIAEELIYLSLNTQNKLVTASKFICITQRISLAVFFSFAVFSPLIEYFESSNEVELVQALAFPSWFPFVINSKTWFIAYFLEIFYILTCFSLFFSFLLFTIVVSIQIVDNFKYLSESFSKAVDHCALTKSFHSRDHPIKVCLRSQRRINSLIVKFRTAVAPLLGVYFASVIWLLCSSLVAVQLGLRSTAWLFKFFLKAAQEASLLYVLCWCSEKIVAAQETFESTVYLSKWHELSLSDRKLIHIALTNSVRSFYLVTYWGQTASFETFKNVINATYSLLSLILAIA